MRKSNSLIPANPLIEYLNKPTADFTKKDIIDFIKNNGIEMLNFRYVGGDGRLKTLNFVLSDEEHLDSILSCGERVDGSSLFSNIEAGSSDLYVIPRFRTAFINPFNETPTIDILCSYFNKDGDPFESAPENILHKAHEKFKETTGYTFEAMGELEYYLISEAEELFRAGDQRGYHESEPFTKWEFLRQQAMRYIAQAGGKIKYAHSEVGNFFQGNQSYEQNELEFLPTSVEDAADQLVIAKWIIRMLAYQHNALVSFAPKITTGKAGSGMHIHTRISKNGKSVMIDNGALSAEAKKSIAGYLKLSPSLTAFGNTNPTSYFRLVPNQEAPTNICWGDRNRSVLVRVPLGWRKKIDMVRLVNPAEEKESKDYTSKQTVEFRCPDGSADIYLLLAGLTVAARHGFESEDALEFAEKTYVDVNIFREENREKLDSLQKLPMSCYDSAQMLEDQKDIYLNSGVFSKHIIEDTIKRLRGFKDQQLRSELENDPQRLQKLVEQYFHCG